MLLANNVYSKAAAVWLPLNLFGLRLIPHIADGVDGDKGFGIHLTDVVHQLLVLVFVNDGDHLHFRRLVVSTDDLIQRCTAVQRVQNIINDIIQIFGNDANSALDIDTENEMIHDHTAKVCTQQAENDSLAIIAKCGGQSHGNTGIGHCLTQINSQVFVQDLCDDVQATGRCVPGEQNCQTDAYHQNIADHIQQRILGDGLEVGEDPFKDTHDQRHQNGAVDRLGAKLRTNENEANDQKTYVHDQGDGGNRERNEVAQHHSQSGTAAHGNVAWQHKEEYSCGDDGGAYRDDGKLLDGIADFHVSNLFCYVELQLLYITFHECKVVIFTSLYVL